MNNSELAAHYLELLEDINLAYLDPLHPDTKCGENMLSGLFLPSLPDGYEQSRNKILIIGRETRGWNVLKTELFPGLPAYIEKSMARHKSHSEVQFGKSNGRGRSYFNFARRVTFKCGPSGVVHANLFSFDWKMKSPIGCPHEDVVKLYSERLLKFQIDFFKPDIVIFAHGSDGIDFRRQLFPNDQMNNVCIKCTDAVEHPHPIKYFWEFDLYGKIRSFRVPHPSARPSSAREAHEYLITMLPDINTVHS